MESNMNDKDWKKKLTKEQYNVLRKKGTEIPFSGALLHNKKNGMYKCAGCGSDLFDSNVKFDSGTGWPSFTQAKLGTIEFHEDVSFGMKRVEVTCKKCGGHLGHVFDDGPNGKKRYCINSCSLDFKENSKQ
jgi:methionine-R-sulfoxide reductase